MRPDEYNTFHFHNNQHLEYREPRHEFPRYIDGCHDMIQADWEENRPFRPEFIRNKPNVVTRINRVVPDHHGVAHINAESIGIDGIPNQEIYIVASAIFPEI